MSHASLEVQFRPVLLYDTNDFTHHTSIVRAYLNNILGSTSIKYLFITSAIYIVFFMHLEVSMAPKNSLQEKGLTSYSKGGGC
jgi:hypothetical protein